MQPSTQAAAKPGRISCDDLKSRLASGEAATVLDVRSEKDWQDSGYKMSGAVRVNPEELPKSPPWPRDRLTVTYCA